MRLSAFAAIVNETKTTEGNVDKVLQVKFRNIIVLHSIPMPLLPTGDSQDAVEDPLLKALRFLNHFDYLLDQYEKKWQPTVMTRGADFADAWGLVFKQLFEKSSFEYRILLSTSPNTSTPENQQISELILSTFAGRLVAFNAQPSLHRTDKSRADTVFKQGPFNQLIKDVERCTKFDVVIVDAASTSDVLNQVAQLILFMPDGTLFMIRGLQPDAEVDRVEQLMRQMAAKRLLKTPNLSLYQMP